MVAQADRNIVYPDRCIRFWAAQRNGVKVQQRLRAHEVKPLETLNVRLIVGAMALGGVLLIVGLWIMEPSSA